MKELVSALAILCMAAPAQAGGGWYDDDVGYEIYDSHQDCCVDTYAYDVGTVYAPRDYAPRVYVPYGYVYSAEPDVYGENCIVRRKYRHGYVKEKIECDDDD
jgi:hypothetical protein